MGNILIENISKSYKNNLVLDNISLKFESGRVYGLIGKNGAGKSTLMKIICGIIESDEGLCRIDEDVVIGAMIEEPAAYANLTAEQNLTIFANCFNRELDKNYIENLIVKVGLKKDKRKFKEYSIGMKKRLGLAVAWLNSPNILILDEPTSGIDIDGINDTRQLLKEYMKVGGNTIIISSHDSRDIAALCDELIIIDDGKVVDIIKDFERNSEKVEELYMELIKRNE